MRKGNVSLIIENAVAGCKNMKRSGCNVSIVDGVLYSYNMPIAARRDGVLHMCYYDTCPTQTTRKHWNETKRNANRRLLGVHETRAFE